MFAPIPLVEAVTISPAHQQTDGLSREGAVLQDVSWVDLNSVRFRFVNELRSTGKQGRQANEGGEWVGDDIGGNSREIRPQSTFILEPLAKRALGKDHAELRHYSARYVNTAKCTKRQREIAGDCPEHGTEHVDRFAAARFTIAHFQVGDLRGSIGGSRHAVDLSKRVVKVNEAGSR